MQRKPLFLTSLLTAALLAAVPAQAKTQFGITVPVCSFDHDAENFCSQARMREFAKVMREQQPNFVNGLILHTYQSQHSVVNGHQRSWRLVVVDPANKTATPFYWAFSSAGQPDQAPELTFDTATPRLCVKGHIEAYRDSYEWDPASRPQGFCFPYQGAEGTYAGFGRFE